MVKELMHILRTYFITFRYLKKSELSFFWTIIFLNIIFFLVNLFIVYIV